MSRYIDADALRQRMYHEAFETDTDMQKWDSGCWIRYKLFENCIDQMPTISPDEVRGADPTWISVEERLPETRESILGKKSSKVIVAFRFDDGTQGTDTAHTLNGEWVFEDHITVVARTITHWMPLPAPPKGVE